MSTNKGATARHYAQAVFELGMENGALERWRDDLRLLAEYFGNRRLLFVLREPKIPFQRKQLIVRDLLADKVQPESLNLALLLVEREIADVAPGINTNFERLYNDYRGQAVAEVTTALPLDDDLRGQIARQLQAITGKRVLMHERVDPSILGGVVARVGDTLIDGSLRRRFQLLRQQIAEGSFGDSSSVEGVVGPDGGSPSGAGPSVQTDSAPRHTDSAHLAPRSDAQSGGFRPRRNQPNKRRRR